MGIGTHLLLSGLLVVAWVGLDNYIYFRFVLPVLRDVEGEGAARLHILPWLRGYQVRMFLGLLAEVGRRPWFSWHLRHRSLTAAIALTVLAFVGLRMYMRL